MAKNQWNPAVNILQLFGWKLAASKEQSFEFEHACRGYVMCINIKKGTASLTANKKSCLFHHFHLQHLCLHPSILHLPHYTWSQLPQHPWAQTALDYEDKHTHTHIWRHHVVGISPENSLFVSVSNTHTQPSFSPLAYCWTLNPPCNNTEGHSCDCLFRERERL